MCELNNSKIHHGMFYLFIFYLKVVFWCSKLNGKLHPECIIVWAVLPFWSRTIYFPEEEDIWLSEAGQNLKVKVTCIHLSFSFICSFFTFPFLFSCLTTLWILCFTCTYISYSLPNSSLCEVCCKYSFSPDSKVTHLLLVVHAGVNEVFFPCKSVINNNVPWHLIQIAQLHS